MLTVFLMVPIVGGVALAIDYSQASRHRNITINALDAAGMATALQILKGASDEDAKQYAKEFFEANLGPVDPADTTLNVVLPNNNAGGGTLKLSATLNYDPIFYPAFQAMRGTSGDETAMKINASSEVRLKNTLEVALVLDNSGSMAYTGSGSGKKRIDLLKEASKELVKTLAAQAGQMKQVSKPVQFGLVPFAASVNVGPENEGASWLDMDGLSPVHHENFAWSTMPDDKDVRLVGGVYRKVGDAWGDEKDKIVTRFTLFKEMTRVTETEWQCPDGETYCGEKEEVPTGWGPASAWAGCVEMRPYPFGLDNTTPTAANPKTLFVPMFAPDEFGPAGYYSYNSWWGDAEATGTYEERQTYMPKYFQSFKTGYFGLGKGPNGSCTTKPITPLTDVSTLAGLTTINDAIDEMQANGATNVPEGLGWGWRVVSGSEPFTQARADTERGNDKVVIVLTDGANTYYTPGSLGAQDYAGNKSIYSNYGYAKNGRIFEGTTVSKSYSNSNYTAAMNQQMDELCQNAKNKSIILMTVALDLSTTKSDESGQIEALKKCASESRFRKDGNGNAAKLFWNATGGDLAEKFKEIADELSNLRFVS
ncbi:hypothetical protein [Nitratireductor luteus]|uniref:hypothetical protein n=1 Tax=Nitratireductor luteus TaxID=2976980 RepID=UPI002240566C|nr:hypothetical protein [Nitratireductor luteus]